MSLLSLREVTIAFGGPPVLDRISLELHKGQRVCLLGRNGVGKSTLLRMLAGGVVPDAGEVVVDPGVRRSYLPQDVPVALPGSVYDTVARGAGPPGDLLIEYLHASRDPAASARAVGLHHDLDENGGWALDTAVRRTIDQMGLDTAAEFGSLSGGLRRRVLLARALVIDPELLLLDEPTNHLDIDSIGWLESFLAARGITTVFVTHDRMLLRRLATRIIELDRGALVDWSCDYDTFLSRKQAVLDAEEKAWERFDKKLAEEEVWIRRGIKARRTRNEGRVRALARMRRERAARRERAGEVAMRISETQRSGTRVIDTRAVSFAYGTTAVVSDVTLSIRRGDRVGIVGPNGCGKTTLINLLLGNLEPQSGTVTHGVKLAMSHFDQLREVLNPERTVWENLLPDGGDTVHVDGKPRHVISYLRDFLFTSDRARSPVLQLSGGERNRLLLARLFTRPANVLVFDEPTNDLDAETLELFEELLAEFSGTVLVVSHDRQFLNNVATSIVAFEGSGRFKEYVGGYDDWAEQRPAPQSPRKEKGAGEVRERRQQTGPRKLGYMETRELEALPARIETLEAGREDLHASMADPTHYREEGFIRGARERLSALEAELAAAYARWEELEARAG